MGDNADVAVYLYRMVIWTGVFIPHCKIIKLVFAEDDINKIRNWIAGLLDKNALCLVDNKEKIHCIDRTEIRKITIKQIKKL